MRHLTYAGVLAACLACAIWLEPALRVGVLRRWRRLALTVLPVLVAFLAWDALAIRAGHWRFDQGQLLGVTLPGGLPVEEIGFFVVIPVCAILGLEAVRRVTGWTVGDEPPRGPTSGSLAPNPAGGDEGDAARDPDRRRGRA
jgi:lycopene cyclase domain-containing protein